MTQSLKTVIFSPTEGFWNDKDGWSGTPEGATIYDDASPGDGALFIGIDSAHVDIKKCIALDWDEAINETFNSFAQYKGDEISHILNTLMGISLVYQGDSLWVDTANEDERTLDPEMLQECMSFHIEKADTLLTLLNTHCDGTWYEDTLSHGFFSANQ
jgi:hypothetical protein